MKALAVIRCANNFAPLAERCKASFEYFHPDIEVECAYAEKWRQFISSMKLGGLGIDKDFMLTATLVGYLRMLTEGYDLIIMLDSDVVVTGRLDEMLAEDYEIGVSHSIQPNFYNAGIWSSRSSKFIKEYYDWDVNTHMDENWIFVQLVNYYEQYRKDVRIKVLDDKDVWYNERSRQWWNILSVKNDSLYTPDREVKILHWAGGMGLGVEKRMSCSLFSDDVKQWLNRITNTTTFTDYDGTEFGEFIKNTYKGGM
jgi:hypothetical protein